MFALYQNDPKRDFLIRADSARPHLCQSGSWFLDDNSYAEEPVFIIQPDMTSANFWIFMYMKGVSQAN
jgi:hypothetical protein